MLICCSLLKLCRAHTWSEKSRETNDYQVADPGKSRRAAGTYLSQDLLTSPPLAHWWRSSCCQSVALGRSRGSGPASPRQHSSAQPHGRPWNRSLGENGSLEISMISCDRRQHSYTCSLPGQSLLVLLTCWLPQKGKVMRQQYDSS